MKLKPCPFCGGNASFKKDWAMIQCDKCYFFYNAESGREGTEQLWNQRPESTLKRSIKTVFEKKDALDYMTFETEIEGYKALMMAIEDLRDAYEDQK